MARTRKFTGKLAKPLAPFEQTLAILADPSEIERRVRERKAAIEERMNLLAIHYGKAPGPHQWKELALVLARELCPGLQEKSGAGRKTTWGDVARGVLVVELEQLAGGRPADIKDAAEKLSKVEPWKSFLKRRIWTAGKHDFTDPGEVLRKVYIQVSRGKWAELCRKCFAYHQEAGDLDGWKSLVLDALNDNSSPVPVLSEAGRTKRKQSR